MVLYTLKNLLFQMEVFEDRLVFRPAVWIKMGPVQQWREDVVVPYHRVTKIELHEKIWPLRHDLAIHTPEQVHHFRFRDSLSFFQRLAPYLERQAEKYRNHPDAFPPAMKSVFDLVEERRKKAIEEFLRVA
jgi:hypothetical protein